MGSSMLLSVEGSQAIVACVGSTDIALKFSGFVGGSKSSDTCTCLTSSNSLGFGSASIYSIPRIKLSASPVVASTEEEIPAGFP